MGKSKKNRNNSHNVKYIVGGLSAAGVAAGASVATGAAVLFNKAIMRSKGPDDSMADELADSVKMATYMERSEAFVFPMSSAINKFNWYNSVK